MKCWEKIRDFIPRFQYEKLDYLCEILKVEYAKVQRVPKTIDQFVQVMSDLKIVSERFDELTSLFQEIEQYNILIDEHKIKVVEKNK